MRYGYDWRPYVPVGQKRAQARRFADKLAKKQKRERQPIEIEGRHIAKSFWGKAWCDHLKSLSDYANRLPRGGTYVRNGSVVDLVIKPGLVNAVVAGSDPYEVSIKINKLGKKIWDSIKKDCSSSIDSLIDLLGGRLSDGVMHRLTDRKSGCFPSARQIEMDCSCPDWSSCCKHIAAVMYAIGSRLDSEPALLFLLRGVNQEELISQAVSKENLANELTAGAGSSDLAGDELGAIFGIDLESSTEVNVAAKRSKTKTALRTNSRRAISAKPVSQKKPTVKTANKASKKSAKKVSKRKTAAAVASEKTKTVVKKKSVKKKKVAAKKVTPNKAANKRTATKKSRLDQAVPQRRPGKQKRKLSQNKRRPRNHK